MTPFDFGEPLFPCARLAFVGAAVVSRIFLGLLLRLGTAAWLAPEALAEAAALGDAGFADGTGAKGDSSLAAGAIAAARSRVGAAGRLVTALGSADVAKAGKVDLEPKER